MSSPATRAVVGAQVGLMRVRVGVADRRSQHRGGEQRQSHHIPHDRHHAAYGGGPPYFER